jgi:PAS domain-containing protein
MKDTRDPSDLMSPIVNVHNNNNRHMYYRTQPDAAPDAIVDQSVTIVVVNVKAEKLFGYHLDELIGQSAEILIFERSAVGDIPFHLAPGNKCAVRLRLHR